MSKLNLAIIHGIGVNKPGYATGLVAGIRREPNGLRSCNVTRTERGTG